VEAYVQEKPGNLQSKALRHVLIITVHRKPKPRELRDYAVPVLVSDASGWFPVSDPAEESLAYRLAGTVKIEPAVSFIHRLTFHFGTIALRNENTGQVRKNDLKLFHSTS